MVDVERLKARIKDSGMTIVSICEKANMTRETFYNRLRDPNYTISEALKLKGILHLSNSEFEEIFLR